MAINLSKFMTEDEQAQKGQRTRSHSKRRKMIKFKNSDVKKNIRKGINESKI